MYSRSKIQIFSRFSSLGHRFLLLARPRVGRPSVERALSPSPTPKSRSQLGRREISSRRVGQWADRLYPPMPEPSMQTRAAVLRAFREPHSIEHVLLRDPGPGEVLVRIVAAGICHSDVGQADGEWGFPLPAVLGHEGAGVVEAVGPGVTSVAPGRRVAAQHGARLRSLPSLPRRAPDPMSGGSRRHGRGPADDRAQPDLGPRRASSRRMPFSAASPSTPSCRAQHAPAPRRRAGRRGRRRSVAP